MWHLYCIPTQNDLETPTKYKSNILNDILCNLQVTGILK